MGMNRDRYLFMFHNKQKYLKHSAKTSLSIGFSLVSKHIASYCYGYIGYRNPLITKLPISSLSTSC